MIKFKEKMDVQTILILIIIGVAAGILGGLIGIGGGIIIVPALVFFLGFTQLQAQGTSLGILLLPVGLLAVWQFYKAGHIDLRVVGIVSLAFFVGGYFGSKIAVDIDQKILIEALNAKSIHKIENKPKIDSNKSVRNVQSWL